MSFTEFWQNFYNKYIGYGQYQDEITKHNTLPPNWGVFSKYHIIMSLIMIAFIVYFTYRTRKYTSKELNKAQKKIAIVMLLLELFRTIMFQIFHIGSSSGYTYLLRFDYCNQVCLFMPIFVLLNTQTLFPFLAAVSFWGGVGVLCYPSNVWAGYGGWHILPIQSMVSHGLMVLSSINLARMFKVDLKHNFIQSAIGFGIMASISAFFGYTRKENYMAVLDPTGLPAIQHIPSPGHYFTLIAIIELGLFLFLLMFKYLDKYVLCVDLKDEYYGKETTTNELQKSNITL